MFSIEMYLLPSSIAVPSPFPRNPWIRSPILKFHLQTISIQQRSSRWEKHLCFYLKIESDNFKNEVHMNASSYGDEIYEENFSKMVPSRKVFFANKKEKCI